MTVAGGTRQVNGQAGGWMYRMQGYNLNLSQSLNQGFVGLKHYWRFMLMIFAAIFVMGALVAMLAPKSYTANASLLMQLGANYVFDPQSGNGSPPAVASIDEVVQSEVEILNSAELKRRVLTRVGLKALAPDAPGVQKIPGNTAPVTLDAKSENLGIKALTDGFATGSVPNSNIVRLSFKHKDAQTAALILNSWVEEYRAYRREVFKDRLGPALEAQKQNFDVRLTKADEALQAFLERNQLADFNTARQTYTRLYDQSVSEGFGLDESIAQNNARLRSVNARLSTLSPEISVQRDLDLTLPSKIAALKQQRQELLSRYRPDAQPVVDLDTQIAAYQTMINNGDGVGEKEHRLGVNPIYQEIMTQKLNLESELAALSGRRNQLQAQNFEVSRKLKELMGLEAEYNALSGERDALQKNLGTFINRQQANEAANAISSGADEGVRVVDAARPPEKSQSLRKPLLILSFLIALITALCAGLLRVFMQPGTLSAQVTSSALGLPILAQARLKA